MTGVLLVTGGGRGMGAAIAKLAAKRGYKVAVNYGHSADRAKAVATEIERAGGHAVAIKADVGVEAEIVQMFGTVDRELGRVTALVNNAGIMDASPAASLSADAITGMFRTNTTSMFVCIREAVRRMSPEFGGNGGAIVNISSMAAKLGGLPKFVAYAASKGAVDTMTVGFARELAPARIRINAVRPGLTKTDMLNDAGGPDVVLQGAKATIPLGRLGEPEEIANLVLWLLSDEASYITGALYDVSGGR
jgi:NAD(P)-dependent dehydrogenase (short-subunit alcohol dehydrogenase family)